jgi:hypothetical protein
MINLVSSEKIQYIPLFSVRRSELIKLKSEQKKMDIPADVKLNELKVQNDKFK